MNYLSQRAEMLIAHWLVDAGQADLLSEKPFQPSAYDHGWNEATSHILRICAEQLREELNKVKSEPIYHD